jgi:glutathione S-transferase
MLTIYGSDLSGPANKVRFVANFLKIPYQYRRINLAEGEQKQEWFLKINPIGKVPALNDDGFCLFESGAMVKYLCDKSPSSLYPEDPKQKAIVEQWIDFANLHISVNVSKIVYNRFFAPKRGWPVSQESIADGEKFVKQYLPYIDHQLGQQKYLASQQLTLADMTLLAALDPCEVAQIDLSPYSNIIAWRQNLRSQDFYTQCHKEYGESLKQTSSK